ncbi:MAG: hypothetical protein KC643_31470 [Nitrospira sp.]|nr:hypothetical protein [Nitrospira sp.]
MKAITALAIPLLLGLFVESSFAYSNVEPAANDIWVSISFQRGPFNDSPNGLLAKSVFDDVTSGRIQHGWLELHEAYWEVNGRLVPLRIAGAQWGYSDRIIFPIEAINRIIPLSAEAIASIEQSAWQNERSSIMSSVSVALGDVLGFIAGILLLNFSLWASWHLYGVVKHQWSMPEKRGNARVLFFILICFVLFGVFVLFNVLTSLRVLLNL